ncbi:MAG: hypothetical protein F4190_02120 [Acidimicrobiales bacterium]|nr:hypothetical protein [Acidimicrobiales bacterium]
MSAGRLNVADAMSLRAAFAEHSTVGAAGRLGAAGAGGGEGGAGGWQYGGEAHGSTYGCDTS